MIAKYIEILIFLIGFFCGSLVFYSIYGKIDKFVELPDHLNINSEVDKVTESVDANESENTENLVDFLYNKVRIVCLVLTYPANHESKAQHVKTTWGSKCNKLIFLSSEQDDELGAIAIHFNESRDVLWGKVKYGFQYAYDNYFNEGDWFLKADDDSYMIMENLRYILYQYRPQTAIYMGHRFVTGGTIDGYMSGGGYILSKKALWKFATKLVNNCRIDSDGDEDLEMGVCLTSHAIPVDAHDRHGQNQFFPIGVDDHFSPPFVPSQGFWYPLYQWFKYPDGSLDCCSEAIACLHYIPPQEMYLLNYLIYNVHPFGLVKNYSLELPQKFTLQEIIENSDVKSSSPNFVEHEFIHHLDSDEKF